MKLKRKSLIGMALMASMCVAMPADAQSKQPVEYVNPIIGNISHLLVPMFPTIQLPNSMMRVYPMRADYTSEYYGGLPIVVTTHRESSAFNLLPQTGEQLVLSKNYPYDNEHITPYAFDVVLDNGDILSKMAVEHQSAIYELQFTDGKTPNIVVTAKDGGIKCGDNWISGWQSVGGRVQSQTKVYVYLETETKPVKTGVVENGHVNSSKKSADGKLVGATLTFGKGTKSVRVRYGVSFISEEQAKANLRREISNYDLQAVAAKGKQIWNETLGKLKVNNSDDQALTEFYSSYYRTFERPICMSEDGKYWSAFDNKVHEDGGTPFYTDDWIWDTYRAAHPLRTLMNVKVEENILSSYLTMAEQMGTYWMPTFPEVNGDSRRMNSNHGVATFADAINKGLNVDKKKAFEYARKGIEEKTLAPWSGVKAGWIDDFYKKNGYIPALKPGEQETDPNVHRFEKRQPIAVTLGTSYDEWCLSAIAKNIAKTDKNKKEAQKYAALGDKYTQLGLNYRNVFNPETSFFHPKDKDGKFIEPFDYRYSGGMGAREYYGENNGWVYRWDVPHNVADLIRLMGGKEKFVKNLDQTFAEPLGKSKYAFYAQLPDHTGNVGQFSMANEPSLHIPYLYNYAGKPWKTQKRIRQLLNTWFRPDVMGMPGDEDGSGMTSFVVFSYLGLYPVTPGMPIYNIGSPMFPKAEMKLSNGKVFTIIAQNVSNDNKYIQSAKLNGKEWNKPWITHQDVVNGGVLELVMGSQPNKAWGAKAEDAPPSLDF